MSAKERKAELKAKAKELGVELDGRMSAESMEQAIGEALSKNDTIAASKGVQINEATISEEIKPQPKEEVKVVIQDRESAQRRADRIWQGQSPNLSKTERKTRIYKALEKLDYSESEIMKVVFPE